MASLLLLIISLFIVPFSLPSHESSVNTINVTNSSQLVQYLCHSTFKTDLHLVLISPSIYQITDNESLCEVRVHGIIYIMGTSHHTVIHCNSAIGFVFNSYSVIIYSVTIENCGASLQKLNISLPIINKEMSSSYIHYAAIFINSKVNITSSNFYFSDCNNGGGLFIYYSDHQKDNKANLTSVDVANSRVNHICDNHNAVSGLTLLYTQKNFHVKTKVHSFKINATVLIISLYATTETIIDKSIFYGHHRLIFHGKISHTVNPVNVPLVIKATSFSNNINTAIKINVTSVVPLTIVLTNIVFLNNTHSNGPCMYAVENTDKNTANLTISMSNVSAFYNSLTDSSDAQLKFGMLNFQGKIILHLFNGLYCSNYGSVFGLYYGVTLIMTGKLIFKNNVAQNGAALILHHSNLILNGTKLQFLDNTALEKGGVIYAQKANISVFMTTSNIVSFANNAAFMSGNSVYAYPIENKTTLESFNFTHITNNHLHEVSTAPVRIIPCEQQYDYKHVYAGEKITIMMKALDQWNRSVFRYVFITVAKTSNVQKHYPQVLSSDWHIPIIDYYQIIEERNDNTCTALNLTLLTGEDKENTGVILVSASDQYPKLRHKHKINLKPCPIGFENTHDICHCDALIGNATNGNCYITNKTIISHNIFWIGNYNTDNGPSLAYSKYCPITYCSIRDQFLRGTTIKVTDTNEFKIVTTDGAIMDICEGNRSGVLCGKCVNGTSLVLGSDKCHVCNNWWLLSLLLYAIAGPLLIYLLHALKLTLTTGTLNGIIFYAQAANCGLLDFIVYPTYYHDGILALFAKVATAFLAFLNLENGYPFCLYNGMTMLAKSFFTLLFVVYLLLLILLVIIVSHYSTRLSNHIANSSVQVLVTVVHLSFYHLMDTVIKVFSSTEVYIKNFGTIHVWSFDGSVGFLSKEHVTLIIFTLVIVIALLLPYIVILLGGRLLLKYCDKLRPVYEAIHGPYKEKNNYWFTARLLLLIAINIIYISLRSINIKFIVLFTGVLLILFTVAQAHIKPFKNKFINMLDLFVMVLFLFQYIFSWYAIMNEEKSWYCTWAFVVSALIIFTIFIAIIIGHILWVTGKWHKIKLLFHRQSSCNISEQVRGSRAGYESYYGSCHIREPVLDM